MLDMSVTCETSQVLRGWLKEVAEENIQDMSVTFEVFHVERDWLKEESE